MTRSLAYYPNTFVFESAQQITQKCVVDKRRVCACTIYGRSIFFRRFHLQPHDTKQLATGFSNDGVTTRMPAFTNMFHKMHLIRSASRRHANKIFASPAARASQGITIRRSQSVSHPRALRGPSAAPSSRCTLVHRPCLESRYQAFIVSRNRLKLVCLESDLVLTVYATTIIIAFVITVQSPVVQSS